MSQSAPAMFVLHDPGCTLTAQWALEVIDPLTDSAHYSLYTQHCGGRAG